MPATSPSGATLQSLLAELDRASADADFELLTRFTDEEDTIPDDLHATADEQLRASIFNPKGGRRALNPPRTLNGCRILLGSILRQRILKDYFSPPDEEEMEFFWDELEAASAVKVVQALIAVCYHVYTQGANASFKELRRFRLFGRAPKVAPALPNADELQATVAAWNHSYEGSYPQHLHRQMQKMKDGTTAYYSNVLPIIQSSGTGKSRLAYEVSGMIVTLPLNVHRPADSTTGFVYPEPDTEVANYLANSGHDGKRSMEDTMRRYHLAFLCSLMQTAKSRIEAMHPRRTYENYEHLASDWRAYLSGVVDDVQSDEAVTRKAEMYHDAVLGASMIYESLRGLGADTEKRKEYCQKQGLKPLLRAIESRVRRGVETPPILLLFAIDEVDGLSDVPVDRPGVSPATITAYDVFLSALQDLGPWNPIFVLTLSTHSRLDKHAPSQIHHLSTRGMGKDAFHQAPWTELPFDILLDGKPVFVPGTVTLDDVAQAAFMVKLGRVLWHTRWEGAADGSAVRAEILKFAFVKLTRRTPEALAAQLKENKTPEQLEAMKLSAISMRVVLDFDLARQSTRDLLQMMIARHMHIAYTVPLHREYVRSGAPSEPVLAHAAAMLMNNFTGLVDTPAILSNALQQGMVDKGARGELVGRLLMIRAHDRAHDLKREQLALDASNVNWSAKVPVIDLLKALFADRHHSSILNATPEDSVLSSNTPSLQEAFKGAFVRYTHFVRLARSDIYDAHVGVAGLARGMAFQSYSQQRHYDLVIPILMKDEALHDSLVSFILIQIKDRLKTQAVIVKTDTGMFSSGTKLPYIVIVMELGLDKPEQYGVVASRGKERSRTTDTPAHPLYKITATGCTPEVYSVISDKDSAHYTSLLARQDIFSEHPRQDSQSIDMVRRMKPVWDRDSSCFDWVAGEELTTPRKP